MANTPITEILNDLIRINNDRIEGYEKALTETESLDVDLKGIFNNMANESRDISGNYVQLLKTLVMMQLKALPYQEKYIVPGWTSNQLLAEMKELLFWNFVSSEKTLLKKLIMMHWLPMLYMSTDVRQMITNQQQSLKKSHDIMKKYRDLHQSVS